MAFNPTDPYRLISDNMQDVVTLHALDGTTLFASPSIERILGLSPEMAVKAKPLPRVHPDDVREVNAAVQVLLDGRASSRAFEFRFRHLNGQYIWLETIIAPVCDEATGAVTHYQTSSRDVRRRKQTSIALRRSEERFRHLAALSADWFWELDSQFRFSFHSQDVTAFTRVPRGVLMGKTRWELWPRALSPQAWEIHRATLAAHRPFYNLTLTRYDQDSEAVTGYSTISGEPFYDESGTFQGYRGVGQDVTDRKNAELTLTARTAELAMTNRRLEEEASRRLELERNVLMAIETELTEVGLELHDDLGQNLTGIALLTKTLETKLRDQRAPEAASATRIIELVNRTIKHTRMISHGLSPHFVGHEGLISAIAQLTNDIEVLGEVRCEAFLDRRIRVSDEVVARSFYRMAQESINNALKYSRASHIDVRLFQRGNHIHLIVSDDGDAQSAKRPTNKSAAFHSLRHRSSVIGAQLTIDRPVTGGTRIHVIWQDPNHVTSDSEQTENLVEAG